MSRTLIPNPLKRRHLLAGELAAETAREIAEAYIAENRAIEAVDFLAKAGDEEGLRSLRESAIQIGDVFLLRETSLALKEPITAESWAAIAHAADQAGLERYALEARRQGDRLVGGTPQ